MSQLFQNLLQQRQQEQASQVIYRFLLKGESQYQSLSYGQLWQSAASLASYLQSQYAQGSHILLLFEPGLEFCQAFWACLLAGMVAVPVYPPADPRLRERFMVLAKDAGAVAVLTTSSIKKLISLARWFVPSLRKLDWMAIDTIQHSQIDLQPLKQADPLALLQYTSGSTDTPRGVMLSQQNIWQNLHCLDAARLSGGPRAGTEEVVVSWLPLYHDMGLMAGVVFPVYLGASSNLMSPLHFLQKPIRWLKAVSDYRATISAAPNFAYEFCLKRIRDEQMTGLDLSSWDGSLNGAEMIRASTVRDFIARFKPYGLNPHFMYPSYGLAETTVFAAGWKRNQAPLLLSFSRQALQAHRVEETQDRDDQQELVAVGTPFEDTQIRIVDPETLHAVTVDRVGEVWLRGGSIGQGYWQQPEATATYFKAQLDGQNWLRTGDLGFIYQGQLFLCGRIKELIILQGQNYAPQSFEAQAETAHPAIRTGCVAAFGSGQPEELVILAEIKPSAKVKPVEIQAAIQQVISENYGVKVAEIVCVPKATLLKTSSGKLRRLACKALYEQKKLKLWK